MDIKDGLTRQVALQQAHDQLLSALNLSDSIAAYLLSAKVCLALETVQDLLALPHETAAGEA